MPESITPRRGLRFEHARQRVAVPGVKVGDCPHAVCEVTRVTAYSVYFRNHTGFKSVVDRDRFPEIVLRVVEGDAR